LNIEDEIEVFSKEDFPFYNRVLLPDYISGALPWDNLIKMNDDEEIDYNIKLHRGVSIENIDKTNKDCC
jgi:ferredoxin-nitrate reductase